MPSCADRSAALNEQISRATKTKSVRWMTKRRYSVGECMPVRENHALTKTANAVATKPGFHPPYQALTMTATAKTTRGLSKTAKRRKAGMREGEVVSTAKK